MNCDDLWLQVNTLVNLFSVQINLKRKLLTSTGFDTHTHTPFCILALYSLIVIFKDEYIYYLYLKPAHSRGSDFSFPVVAFSLLSHEA